MSKDMKEWYIHTLPVAVSCKIEGAFILIPRNSISESQETLASILKETRVQILSAPLCVTTKSGSQSPSRGWIYWMVMINI